MRTDPAANRKFDKIKSTGRIDGIVALAMAMGLARMAPNNPIDFDVFLANPVILG
jgi:phage terminase large subunit-like protein